MRLPWRERFCKLLKERKKQIIFRFLALGSLFLDLFSVYKKCIRGHWEWSILSVASLVLSSAVGSLYSLWWDVLEAYSKENTFTNKKKVKTEPSYSALTSDYRENIAELDAEDSPEEEEVEEGEEDDQAGKPPKKKKAKRVAIFIDDEPRPSKDEKRKEKKKEKIGTYAEPSFLGPSTGLQNQDHIENEKQEEKIPTMGISDFLVGIQKLGFGMIISHVILFAKEYRFCEVTQLLWKDFYNKEQNWEAHAELERRNVKKVSYDRTWNDYCRKEMVSKNLSILIAILQTIPMTLIDLSYWSFKSEAISNYGKRLEGDASNSSFISASFGGEDFNILELISLILNLAIVAYRQISVTNQVRKIDFSREDMRFVHLVFLCALYFFNLLSRVSAIYFVMSLSLSSVVFVISILLVQFLIMTLKDSQSMSGVSKAQLTVSNILMLFLYLPAKSGNGRDISVQKYKYDIITFVEMMAFFIFGYFQLEDMHSSTIYLVGHEVQSAHYFVGYAVSFGLFVIGLILNTECLSKKLFTYREKLNNDEITKVLNQVNGTHNTEFKIIMDHYGQDEAQTKHCQTIYIGV